MQNYHYLHIAVLIFQSIINYFQMLYLYEFIAPFINYSVSNIFTSHFDMKIIILEETDYT